ncbi:acylneuraminate cytidylyltransferase family protein [Roseibacterium sp. SDUM158016]|uniref:acylneuraminate cytidylyltransferase family protein n=1 Tax=Roseicyclus sediminis TaxID=2980997 RepID=UPI0021D22CF7|nr:acylneuraminate cytidylyltransferase family protein [Roseibacterium sp. SDUM158016]MCU4654160.1 acylneuraminate cytidylyltransferase family protein [Roseibacterium sp. SDUM158016]
MIGGRRVLAVVPARGGSKGIPLKNLREVGGRSLVAHAAAVAAAVPEIDRSVVSTDHEGIAAEAEAHGLAAPFRRPEALSGDRVGDWEVLHHALIEMERIDDCRYDIVVMLQPTSPLRTAANVRDTVVKLVEGGHDAVWTVSPTDLKYHPLKQLSVDDGRMSFFDPRGAGIIARQQLSPVYHRNGVAYAFTRDCLLHHGSIMGPDTGAVVIEDVHVSIDTLDDIELVEAHLRRK